MTAPSASASPRKPSATSTSSAAPSTSPCRHLSPISCSCGLSTAPLMRDPAFWWADHSLAATLLAPVGALYGVIAARRMARPGCKAPVPVICVGNFTLGGAGKTPTAIALARLLLESGRRPFFLSRGYGGRVVGPVRVHQPSLPQGRGRAEQADVGDEPLLLARVAPTVV